MTSLPVLPSCRAVTAQSRFVQVDSAAISAFVDSNPGLRIPPLPLGPQPYHYFEGTAKSAEWIFVLDTLNHCFWPEPGSAPWSIHYGGTTLSGYWALAASLKRAMEEGIGLERAETLACLRLETLRYLFRGRGEIPLLEERLANLRQVGEVLLDRFQGRFVHVLEEARGLAVRLVLLVAAEFASFNDQASHWEKKVYFFKRAQLLALDLWCAFCGKSWGALADLEQLTAFADYKLPQVLRHLGIIRFEPQLATLVDSMEPLPPGSTAEVEIRAATVWAVECLRRELTGRGLAVNSALLDSWLWHLSQNPAYCNLPHHRTRTIFY